MQDAVWPPASRAWHDTKVAPTGKALPGESEHDVDTGTRPFVVRGASKVTGTALPSVEFDVDGLRARHGQHASRRATGAIGAMGDVEPHPRRLRRARPRARAAQPIGKLSNPSVENIQFNT